MERARNIALALTVLTGIWFSMWLFPFINRVRLVATQNDYIPGLLSVEQVEYWPQQMSSSNRIDFTTWWAIGTIDLRNGERAAGEKLLLNQLVPDPGSWERLAQRVPPGTTYEVIFNPNAAAFLSQDEWLRVMAPRTPSEWAAERRMRDRMFTRTILPFVLSVTALTTLSIVGNRRKRQAAAGVEPDTDTGDTSLQSEAADVNQLEQQ